MKLKKGPSKEKFPRIEDGNYMSRIVQLVGLGEHLKDDRSPEKGTCGKMLITVEYPTEMITINDEEKPRLQSKTENMFLTEKANLLKIIKAGIPSFNLDDIEEFDFNELLGKPCMTVIGSTATGNPKITAFTPPMKGFEVPPQISESVMFDFDEPDLEIFNGLRGWVQDTIKAAEDYPGSILEGMINGTGSSPSGSGADMGDDVPFACMI